MPRQQRLPAPRKSHTQPIAFFLGTRTDLKLCLGVVLEVLAVAQDLASLDKGDRLSETFLLPHLRVLHPWLEHLSKISTEKK